MIEPKQEPEELEIDTLPLTIKQRWVDALRSGDYRQAYAVLHTPSDEYCCLGVLCQVLGTGTWGTEDDDDPSYYWIEGKRYGGYTAPYLSWETSKQLAAFNDDMGWDFTRIAEFVEENL